MQEIIFFLNQGWVATIAGIGGAALGVFLYWRSRIPGIVAFQSLDTPMIGGEAVFPHEVEVRHRGVPVPKITSSTVWVWNAGKKTVRGSDVVASDPLQFRFGGDVLNIRIRKVTRDVLGITAAASKEASGTVRWDFEFLDPGDGGVLDVLHTGPVAPPTCTGTIIGLPRGIQYRPRGGADSRWKKRIFLLVWLPVSVVMLLLGLSLTSHGVLGILGKSDKFDDPLLAAVIVAFLTLYPVVILWSLWGVWVSLSSPSSLDLD